MQKKLLLIVLYISFSTIKTDNPNIQCYDKHTQLLEKQVELLEEQIELLKEQKTSHADMVQLLALQLQLKTALLEEQKEKQEIMLQAAQAQENKPWYEKAWNTITPAVKTALINFLISTLASKIINGGVSLLDEATGDLLARNGYSKWAIYAGTFVAADSFQQYLATKENKIILSSPEIRLYNEFLKGYIQDNAIELAIGRKITEGLALSPLVERGKRADKFFRRTAEDRVHTEEGDTTSTTSVQNNGSAVSLYRQQGNQALLKTLIGKRTAKVRHENGVTIRDITNEEE